MRVSERMRYDIAVNRLEKTKLANANALQILSSQKKINALHDDPIGATKVIRMNKRLKEIDDYKRNILFTKGFLEVSETSIRNIQERLQRARELAVSMANDTYDVSSRSMVGAEIKELVKEVVAQANSRYNDRYVFSGFRTGTPPLSTDGVYLGDDGKVFIEMESGNYQKINISGRDLFEASESEKKKGHFNTIDSLNFLQQGLNENDKDLIFTAIEELDYQINKMSTYQANIGALWSAANNSEERLEVAEDNQKESISRVEDADIYQATSEFKRTESLLQSTLMAANKMLQPSLMNFMQ